MNHADRERLSQLLLAAWTHNDDGRIADLLAEARAIVDQPAATIHFASSAMTTTEAEEFKATFAKGAPNRALDAFLSEPIHVYADPNAGPTGWAFLQRRIDRRRHRAIRPITLATALTLAAIGLIAATALTTTPSGAQGPRQHSVAPNTPPEAAQHARGGYTYPPRTP